MRRLALIAAALLAAACPRDLRVGAVLDPSADAGAPPAPVDGASPADRGNDQAPPVDAGQPDRAVTLLKPSASLIADRPSQSFGTQPGGSEFTSTPIQVTIINNGDAPTGPLNATVGGQDPGAFFISANTCTAALKPGDRCFVALKFTPAKLSPAGPRGAILLVSDEALNPVSASVPLSGGVSVGDAFSFFPTSAVFPDTLVGTGSQPQTITATNLTTSTGTVRIDMSGADVASFVKVSDLCDAANVRIADNCSVTFTFVPTTPGPKEAVMKISGSQGSAQLSLLGRAVPAIEVLPAAQDFAVVPLGQESAQRIFSVFARSPFSKVSTSVAGEFAVNPAPPALAGAGCNDFSHILADNSGTWQVCSTAVSFRPTALDGGAGAGKLTIAAAGGGTIETTAADLSGTAVP